MATVRLHWVKCEDEQEPGAGNGSDEIYFTFHDKNDVERGKTNLITGMDEGDTFYLTDNFDFSGRNFDNSVEVRLYEYDQNNRDERIDTVNLDFNWGGIYTDQTMVFEGAGAKYSVRYDIIP